MHGPTPDAPRSGPGFSRMTLGALMFLAGVKIWLISGQPLTVIWHSDERAFLLQAQGLLAGQWLGDYTVVSLVKNPFYAVFIAASFLIGLPTLLAQQLTYVAACFVVLVAVRPALTAWTPFQWTLLYALLVFNPMTFWGSPRLLRNHLYASLTLLLLACSIAMFVRVTWALKTLVTWSAACGVVLSALWLTREESLWLAPFLAMSTSLAVWRLWRAGVSGWRPRLLVLTLPHGVLVLLLLTVMYLNQRSYGLFALNEIQSREFLDAIGAIYRVVPRTPRQPYVVAPREMRERLYAISPAFAELRDALEGDLSKQWSAPSCAESQVCGDRDVAWGWFQWQLRDAAWRRGYHESAGRAARFYGRLAAEINAACASESLACIGPRSSLLPPWSRAVAWAFPGAFAGAVVPLVTFRDFHVGSVPSEGPPDELAKFRDLSREDLVPPRSERFSLTGWTLSRAGAVELSVRGEAGHVVESTRQTVARPDVHEYVKNFGLTMPWAADSGFRIAASCGAGCYLSVRTGQAPWVRAVPMDGSVKRFQSTPASELSGAPGKNPDLVALERGDVLLYVDGATRAAGGDDAPFQGRWRAWKRPMLLAIGAVYETIVPVVCVIAVVVLLARVRLSWVRRVVRDPDLIVALVVGMLCARTAALAFIEIVGLRISRVPEYAMSGYPLVLLFGGLLLLDLRFQPSTPSTERPSRA